MDRLSRLYHGSGRPDLGDRFVPGMVFAFNIDLFDPKWMDGKTGCVFAETIEITGTGAQRMHTFSTDFQRLPA